MDFMASLAALVPRLKRVFAIDIGTCPECGGKLRVIACIEAPADRKDPRSWSTA